MSIRTLIIDDEPLARTGLSDFLGRIDFLTEVGQARSGLEALTILESEPVELLLLDVQMPGLSGTELVRTLSDPPAVIFTTAHPSFAVEGFELNAVDYLLKPIAFPRLLRAAMKARDRIRPPTEPARKLDTTPAEASDIFVREEGRVERILIEDILYAEAMQNYCRIHTPSRSYLPLLPLSQLAEALPDHFLSIHRSYLVNQRRVEGLEGNQVRIAGRLLPISRGNREEVLKRLLGNRIL